MALPVEGEGEMSVAVRCTTNQQYCLYVSTTWSSSVDTVEVVLATWHTNSFIKGNKGVNVTKISLSAGFEILSNILYLNVTSSHRTEYT